MHIVLSNDDGFHAQGINALKNALRKYCHKGIRVSVIAPDRERSTTGHGLTLSRALRVTKHTDQEYSCDGLPADCAFLGIGHLFKDDPPDLFISGINYGANLGQDVFYSGTVAAAREAFFRGVPAIATSLCFSYDPLPPFLYFDDAGKMIAEMVNHNILEAAQKTHGPVNLNFPNLPYGQMKAVALSTPGVRKYSTKIDHRMDCRGKDYYWICGAYEGHCGTMGSDSQKIDDGQISLSLYDQGSESEKKLWQEWAESFRPGPS